MVASKFDNDLHRFLHTKLNKLVCDQEYRKLNKEKNAKSNKAWREKNKAHCAKLKREYVDKNRKAVYARMENWRILNRDKINKAARKRYSETPEIWKKANKKYLKNNREKVLKLKRECELKRKYGKYWEVSQLKEKLKREIKNGKEKSSKKGTKC